MQIKITLRYHLIPVRMAKIKFMRTAYVEEDMESGITPSLLVEVQICTATLEISMTISQNFTQL